MSTAATGAHCGAIPSTTLWCRRFEKGRCFMSGLDDAHPLVGAAERDLRALRGMEDTLVFADEIAGFHARPAAERLFKVWLILLGEAYPLTHDPDYLRHLVERREPEAGRFEDPIEYAPYAAQLRYGSFENEAAPIDRWKAVQRLKAPRRKVLQRLPDAERA